MKQESERESERAKDNKGGREIEKINSFKRIKFFGWVKSASIQLIINSQPEMFKMFKMEKDS